MQTSIPKMLGTVTQYILGLILYDVKVVLNDRTDWSIELVSTSLRIHLNNGGHFFMLCALFFLIMAENMRIHYGRLSPAESKGRAERIGYATLAILFAMLDIGTVIVRVSALVALSGSPALTANLALISMSPSILLPLLCYPARLFKRRKRQSTGEVVMESGMVVDGTVNGTS
ncbi:hypothetical protein V8E55_006426 [Tylopilus felleus]